MTVVQRPEMPETPAPTPGRSSAGARRRSRGRAGLAQRYGVIGVWVLLIIVFGALKPSEFLTTTNFETIFDSQGTLLLLALGFIVPLIAGEIDLSLAGSFTIEVVLIGRLDIVHHVSYAPVFLSVVAIGILIGCLQGFLIVTLGLNSLIVTLGTGTAFLGIALGIDTTPRSGVGPGYAKAFSGSFLGLELSFWLALAAVLITWYVFSYTPLGRRMFFVGANPNVAAAIVIGIEPSWTERVQAGIAETGKPVEGFSIERHGDLRILEMAARRAAQMMQEASGQARVPIERGELVMSIKCGESDTTSGLGANPATAQAVDRHVAAGGTVIFGETTELTGGEHLIAARCTTGEVRKKFQDFFDAYLDLVERSGANLLGSQPTQGNIRGGLSTIEEKALGNIEKTGTTPVVDALAPAQRPVVPGLNFMDTSCAAAEIEHGLALQQRRDRRAASVEAIGDLGMDLLQHRLDFGRDRIRIAATGIGLQVR